MKRDNIIALSALAVGVTTQTFAGTEMDTLKDRITALETAASATTISGELAASYTSTGKTAWDDTKVTISHVVNDQFDGSATIKRNADDTISLDESIINYNNENFTVSVGRTGTPFGGFSTSMITDPLTKTDGTTDLGDLGTHDMIILSTTLGSVEITAYTYKATDNDSGVTLSYANDMFSVGYDHFNDGTAAYSSSNAVRAGFDMGNGLSLAYEKVTVDQGSSADHSATHFEANYAHAVAGMDANLAVAKSDQNVAAGDSDQTGFTYSVAPAEGVTFAVERNKVKGVSAVNTAKLTYEF
ncbi:hypothetical protein [uncultured Gammaproteobacteria bacterium]|uniref:hypothetical protein n=1 Tax=Bathymodiolus heckerae thiotrophic gill symbiont TaxID=1052212 RepID=UPI0010AF02BF|nr:hypothetical protein [Bathymodiolus heckerae thiotrophic gill symbiont]CAC9600732.1 hypothetical protein [uncultured Gammaproteobacteria bacterium]CAC9949962.1 hypothetical protein [uncultured Gammaproteobacteria bacterium]CAC9955983.1 hypothetical protein [uncultured Gammaproteobacteria bacterium]SHN89252.1 hypothetical protein BHECKSOX_1523 [Bathymodiolus heckerae thiotrophic gill symbiont]